MRNAGFAISVFLLMVLPLAAPAEDHAKVFLIGTYLGDEMQPDGTNGTGSTLHRTYFVRTEEGTWSLVTWADGGDILAHTMNMMPTRFKSDRPNLLDGLKHGDRFAFRAEPDHRIGAGRSSFHVYIPRADDPKKEDKFDADFTPIPTPAAAAASTDNVKAMCDAHRFTPEQDKQYCGNPQALPVDQATKN
jgi:hypothetical protein